MRFLFEKIPENNDFDPENEGYHAIDEPSFLKRCLMSIPVILISMFIIGLMLKIRLGADYHLSMIDSFQDFVILLALVPIHEMLHVIVFPDKISSRDIFIGTYRGAIYATYLWDIKKERFLLGFNIADHCLTVIPVLFLMISNINYPLLSKIAIMNMVLSSLDVLSFYGILTKIPANAKIQNKDSRSYWRF
ncbi:DUF3267 domain-containing protein [Acetobacterium wieringae]|uniref:DUF3267 domain-containing protein n=1 Tax=Acetobacterium wieringae TaxID=52694 RepID=A0ABY6HC88_9FIRM|nr:MULTISPECIES: DUF3267 domain-containing protein [Acetobacterium]UYO62058.1 DUF3267 domain-containing protein [Acetobacterium wieringae]